MENSNIHFSDLFILVSVIQGLFISFSLIFSRLFKSHANKYLGAGIFVLTIITFFGWLDSNNPILSSLTGIMWEFLFPVFFFIYFRISLDKTFLNLKWTKLLYLPFLVSTIIQLSLDASFIFKFYQLPFKDDNTVLALYNNVEYNLSFFYGIVLIIWAGTSIWNIKNQSIKTIKLLKRLCFSLFTLFIVWLLAELIENQFGMNIWFILWSGLSILFLAIVYLGIYQFKFVAEKNLLEKDKKTITKQANSDNKIKESAQFQLLEKMMLEKELFKRTDLNRDMVAELLGVSNTSLTRIIKESCGKSFLEYVNHYRVNCAKEMLSDKEYDKYSIQAIGSKAGFKSRSVFYSCFQKSIGQSPGEFKKS